MIVGIPKESFPGERRVSMVPAVIPSLIKAGLEVLVERGAGESAGFPDAAYVDKGARIGDTRAQVFADAGILLEVRTVGANPEAGLADLDLFRRGQTVIGFSEPFGGTGDGQEAGRPWRDCLVDGTHPPYHARSKHGRAVLDGHDRGL